MTGIKGLAIGAILSVAFAASAVAAPQDRREPPKERGTGEGKSQSGYQGADIDKSHGSNVGGERRGEASLKQEEREKEDMERRKGMKGPDPLEKQDPGPGSGHSSGGGAGQ
jgi:hypothetical protein